MLTSAVGGAPHASGRRPGVLEADCRIGCSQKRLIGGIVSDPRRFKHLFSLLLFVYLNMKRNTARVLRPHCHRKRLNQNIMTTMEYS